MKNLLYMPFVCTLAMVAAQGCQEAESPETEKTSDILLEVRASYTGFSDMDRTAEPALTAFEAGDTIGVFGIDTDGSVLSGCHNSAFVYDGTSWNGKVWYYDGAVYFAYYPYRKSLSSMQSLQAIAEYFTGEVRNTTDQSTEELFSACNFMADENVFPAGGVLDFTLTSRMSMVEISFPDIEYRTSADSEPYYIANIGGLGFEVNDIAVRPYMAEHGLYRYILVPENNLVYGEYKVAGDWADYGRELVFEPGTSVRIDVRPDETTVIHTLSAGDFFLKSGALLPADATLSAAEQDECVGVVFWAGDPTASDPTLKADCPGCTHGLVVAIDEIAASRWRLSVSDMVNAWIEANTSYMPVSTCGSQDNRNLVTGYNNTMAIGHYNDNLQAGDEKTVSAVENIMDYRGSHSVECTSSGWYLPSIKELALLYKPDGALDTENNSVAGIVNASLGKIDGAAVITGDYWSSTEAEAGSAFLILSSGKAQGTRTYNFKNLRPVLAF